MTADSAEHLRPGSFVEADQGGLAGADQGGTQVAGAPEEEVPDLVVDRAVAGAAVTLLETSDDWSRIRLPDQRQGWVISRYLEPIAAEQTD